MAEADTDHQVSYGKDDWTQRAADLLRGVFETDCEVFIALTARRLIRSPSHHSASHIIVSCATRRRTSRLPSVARRNSLPTAAKSCSWLVRTERFTRQRFPAPSTSARRSEEHTSE